MCVIFIGFLCNTEIWTAGINVQMCCRRPAENLVRAAPCQIMPACMLRGRSFVSNGARMCGLLLRCMGPGLVKAVGGLVAKCGAREGLVMLPHAGSRTLCPNRATELCHPAARLRCRGPGQGQGAARARPRELRRPSGHGRKREKAWGNHAKLH